MKTSTMSRGFGSDRNNCKILADASEALLSLQQFVEHSKVTCDRDPLRMNKSVAAKALDLSINKRKLI